MYPYDMPLTAGLLDSFHVSLPTDPASIFTVVLMLIFFGLIFWVGRGSSDGASGPPAQ